MGFPLVMEIHSCVTFWKLNFWKNKWRLSRSCLDLSQIWIVLEKDLESTCSIKIWPIKSTTDYIFFFHQADNKIFIPSQVTCYRGYHLPLTDIPLCINIRIKRLFNTILFYFIFTRREMSSKTLTRD